MNSCLRKALLVPWKPNVQVLRYRNKINIQRPALPHYQRAKMLKVSEPIYNVPRISRVPSVELCLKPFEGKRKKDEENAYANFLAKQLNNLTIKSDFVGFLHTNSVSAFETFKVKVSLKKVGASMKVYGRQVMEKAWGDTYYEPALCLIQSQTSLVFCPDGSPSNIAAIMKIFQRVPYFLMMAGIVDKKLLDYSELVMYSKLSNLTTERVKLVSVLNAAGGGGVLQDINSLQNTLIYQLQQRANQLESSNNINSEGGSVTDTPGENR